MKETANNLTIKNSGLLFRLPFTIYRLPFNSHYSLRIDHYLEIGNWKLEIGATERGDL